MEPPSPGQSAVILASTVWANLQWIGPAPDFVAFIELRFKFLNVAGASKGFG